MASKVYNVRVGPKLFSFNAQKPEDAERVIALFAAIESRYELPELIGHALHVFGDLKLRAARKIVEATEQHYGSNLIRPRTEDLQAALEQYGLKFTEADGQRARLRECRLAKRAIEKALSLEPGPHASAQLAEARVRVRAAEDALTDDDRDKLYREEGEQA